MNIDRARPVSWYWDAGRESEVQWLAEQASRRHHIVEIGSAAGTTAIAMVDNMPEDGVFVGVDCWDSTDGHAVGNAAPIDRPDALFGAFKKNVGEGLIASGRVRPLRLLSLVAAARLKNERFDMIFIDGGHDYGNIRPDILAWRPLLAPGGLFCGHDFGEHCPDVMRAVRELIPDYHIGAGCIWVA